MKFLVVITSLGLGGAQTFLERLILHGAGRDEYFLVALKPLGADGLRFRSLPRASARSLEIRSQADYLARNSAMKSALNEYVRRERPDVVHGFLWHANRLVPALDAPAVVHVRHWHRLRHWYDWSEIQSGRRAAAVVSNNRLAVDCLRRVNPRTFFLPNMIPDPGPEQTAKPDAPRPFRWICPARILFREKNQDLLLDSFLRVLSRNPEQEIHFAGAGRDRAALADRISRPELDGKAFIIPASAFSWTEIARFDGCLLASEYEGFPNIVLEAAAVGTPVVANAGSVAGFDASTEDIEIVPRLDREAFAAAMTRVIADLPAARMRIARFAERARSAYDPETVADRFREISRLVVDRPNG